MSEEQTTPLLSRRSVLKRTASLAGIAAAAAARAMDGRSTRLQLWRGRPSKAPSLTNVRTELMYRDIQPGGMGEDRSSNSSPVGKVPALRYNRLRKAVAAWMRLEYGSRNAE